MTDGEKMGDGEKNTAYSNLYYVEHITVSDILIC